MCTKISGFLFAFGGILESELSFQNCMSLHYRVYSLHNLNSEQHKFELISVGWGGGLNHDYVIKVIDSSKRGWVWPRLRLITEGEGAKKWQNIDYVICERPLMKIWRR
jgi:hypothetical protein